MSKIQHNPYLTLERGIELTGTEWKERVRFLQGRLGLTAGNAIDEVDKDEPTFINTWEGMFHILETSPESVFMGDKRISDFEDFNLIFEDLQTKKEDFKNWLALKLEDPHEENYEFLKERIIDRTIVHLLVFIKRENIDLSLDLVNRIADEIAKVEQGLLSRSVWYDRLKLGLQTAIVECFIEEHYFEPS